MESFLKIVALLAVIGGTTASEYPCDYSPGELNCTSRDLKLPPPGYWPGVTWLFLGDNPITQFPKNSFSGFPDVTTLYSPNIEIKEVDFNDLAVMSELETINLQFNDIEDLIAPEEEIGVQSLHLFENNIETLDELVFINLSKLSVLSMHKNPIAVTPGRPILTHPNLESLWLGLDSDLGDLDSVVLSGLPNLRYVSLASAQITSLNETFASNSLLETVILTGNPITRITAGAFANTGALKNLYLDRTTLIRLDTAAVKDAMSAGGVINIANTPLSCFCAYEALYWWAAANNVTLDTSCGAQDLCSFIRRLGDLGRAPTLTRAQILGLYSDPAL